jgi:hypothetical protein
MAKKPLHRGSNNRAPAPETPKFPWVLIIVAVLMAALGIGLRACVPPPPSAQPPVASLPSTEPTVTVPPVVIPPPPSDISSGPPVLPVPVVHRRHHTHVGVHRHAHKHRHAHRHIRHSRIATEFHGVHCAEAWLILPGSATCQSRRLTWTYPATWTLWLK